MAISMEASHILCHNISIMSWKAERQPTTSQHFGFILQLVHKLCHRSHHDTPFALSWLFNLDALVAIYQGDTKSLQCHYPVNNEPLIHGL